MGTHEPFKPEAAASDDICTSCGATPSLDVVAKKRKRKERKKEKKQAVSGSAKFSAKAAN